MSATEEQVGGRNTGSRELLRQQTGIAALVYVIDADHGVKVGITRWAIIDERQQQIEQAAGMHMHVLRTWAFTNWGIARRVERAALLSLRDTRTMGEWHHCHPFEACDAVTQAIRDIERAA